MVEQELSEFSQRLIALCQRSEVLEWQETLREVMAALGDFCQSRQVGFVSLDATSQPRWCISLQEEERNLCEALDDDMLHPMAFHQVALLEDAHDAWILPIPAQGKSPKIGFFVLLSPQVACTEERRAVLLDSSALLTQLLQSVCLRRQLTEQASEMQHLSARPQVLITTLTRLIADLNRAIGVRQILGTGLRHAVRIVGALKGEIYLWDPDTRDLKQHFEWRAEDASEEPPEASVVRVSFPLIENEHAVGVLNLWLPSAEEMPEDTKSLLHAILEHIILAMQRDRLRSQMSERLQTMHYLYEISTAFLSQVGSSSVIFILLRAIADLLTNSLGVGFYRRQAGQWTRERVYVTSSAQSPKLPWDAGEVWEGEDEFLLACEQERMLVIAGQKWGRAPAFRRRLDQLGVKQVLYLPLALPNEEVFGVIGVLLPTEELINAHQSALLWAIIQQGASALLRVRLYDESELSKSRLQAILDSSRDGILLVGNDKGIHYVNGQWLRMLEMPPRPHSWQGQSLTSMLAVLENESPAAARWIERVAENPLGEDKTPPLFETAHKKQLEGHHRAVYSRKQQLGSLYIFRDVTEQKMLEQMRDDLFHMLVHDMRNPLAVILSAFQILQDPDMQTLNGEVISIATENANRLLLLVNAMLDIGKLESGRLKLEWQPMVISEQLADILQSLSLAGKQFKLTVSIPDDLPVVWGDPTIVERIFENLLNNALKFVPQENGEIRIVAVPEAEGWVRVEVYNNGPRISDEIFSRLFTKFVTGEYSQRGYGLGLAFCRLAVENHGGHIWAENREQGVSFYFTLPTQPPSD